MASTDLLNAAIDGLGYGAGTGLITAGDDYEPTARGFVWRELLRKGGVEAAYFRGGVPLVAFGQAEDTAGVQLIHRRLWNLSRVPLLIAATPEDVAAYSCFVSPTNDLVTSGALLSGPTRSVNAPNALEEFSRFHVESGQVAKIHENRFRKTGRVDRRLLENLRQLRRRFNATGDRQRALDALIGRSIFVRYFEDRGILTREHLAEISDFDRFIDVLGAGAAPANRLFESLSTRFNGDLFRVTELDERVVTDADFALIASFFAGTDFDSGQQIFWPYDFSIIPPELISSIYEQLLEETQLEDAAFYTPRPVVDLILDETLPWQGGREQVRVLDPACGSGVFLTEAFRRLVFSRTAQSDRQLPFDELSEVLQHSIFGIDSNDAAIGVAALGLYLALLEEVDPPTVWEDGRLPPLVGHNLVVADFFSGHSLADATFDVIVGNPPWKSQLTPDADAFLRESGMAVPDRQIALAFLFRCGQMLREGGVIGLLLPAKPLLHNKSTGSLRARQDVFSTLEVGTVIDLSALRRSTFISAVAPAAVLVARRRVTGDEATEILHVVPQASPLQGTIDGFVVSQQDVKRVPLGLASAAPDLWKTLLWGSMDDYRLISRLRQGNRTLGQVADQRDWIHGQGFQIKGGDQNDASHLVGLPFVATKSVLPFRAAANASARVATSVMHRPRDPRLFAGPHVLIRRGLVNGRPAAALVLEPAAYNNGVFGVAAGERDIDLLRLLTGYVNSSLGHYYQFLTSSSWGVERDFIEENEHLTLPFAEPAEHLRRRVLAAVAGAEASSNRPSEWRSELDAAVFAAYGLTQIEIEQISDVLAMGLDQFEHRSSSKAFQPPTSAALDRYLDALRVSLTDALRHMSIEASMLETSPTYAVASTRFRDQRTQSRVTLSESRSIVAALLDQADSNTSQWPSPATILQPSLLFLDGNAAHLLKPNEARYWTTTAAYSDAAEIVGGVLVAAAEAS